MSKFTPGLWKVNAAGDAVIATDGRFPEDNPICSVHAQEDEAEQYANADLLAAAPDLLEALELAMTHHYDFWAAKARSAITKAKGAA